MTTHNPVGPWVLGLEWQPLGRMMERWKSEHPRYFQLACRVGRPVAVLKGPATEMATARVGFDILSASTWRISDPVFFDNFDNYMVHDRGLFMPLDQIARIPYGTAFEIANSLSNREAIDPHWFMENFARDHKFDR